MVPLSLSEFADRMQEIMPVIFREFASRHSSELFKVKITMPQFLVLNFLNVSGESKMKDLAQGMYVTTAAMTGIVDRLVRDSFVQRTYDPEDRRIIKIRLTPKGLKLVKKVNQQRRQMIVRIFGKIPESDRQDYLRILTQVKDVLNKESSTTK